MKKYLEERLYNRSVSSMLTYLPEKIGMEELSSIFQKEMDDIKEIYPQYDVIKMAFENEYQYYNETDFVVQYWGYRYETDEEYNKRIEQEEKRKQSAQKAAITKKEATIKREKTLLNTLLKKYKDVNI